jgi:hypothetical protein
LVIDALDECADAWGLLESFQEIFTASEKRLRLLVSGRMHINVEEYFPGCFKMGPHNNRKDIVNFIRTEINTRKPGLLHRKRPDLEDRLFEVLDKLSENV